MKKRQVKDLKGKSQDELKKLLSEKRIELIKAKSEMKIGKEKNLKKVKNLRTDISQILTIEKEIEIIKSETDKSEKKKEGE